MDMSLHPAVNDSHNINRGCDSQYQISKQDMYQYDHKLTLHQNYVVLNRSAALFVCKLYFI